MNAHKLLLSAAALALLFTTPSFATSLDATTDTSFETPAVPSTPDAMAAPEISPTIDTPTPAVDAAPATLDAPAVVADPTVVPSDTTTAPAIEEPVTETPAETTPVVEAPAEPAPAPKPAKPKVSPPAKLSDLSKKYDLMSLDTDGDKSLSKSEFTANGFSNAKTFSAFDFDKNGKLTNYEINAYAARIEANSNK